MSSQSGTKSTGQKDIISNQDMIQFFRQHPLCSSLSDSYLETMVSRCCVREYRKGGVIFRKGEPALWIHFIYSGSVSEIINYGGSSDVLSTLRRPGDYIGEMGAMIGEPYPNTAIARVNLATIAMPREAFLELTHENTTIANYITTQFIYRLMKSSRRHINTMHLNAPARLGYILLSLSGAETGSRAVSVTQNDLAASAGVARQTVAIILGEWRRKGWVQTERGRISICDADALLDMINSSEMR